MRPTTGRVRQDLQILAGFVLVTAVLIRAADGNGANPWNRFGTIDGVAIAAGVLTAASALLALGSGWRSPSRRELRAAGVLTRAAPVVAAAAVVLLALRLILPAADVGQPSHFVRRHLPPPAAYLVATYDGSSLRLFVDGAEAAQVPARGPAKRTSTSLEIGSYLGRARFRGVIDSAAVYSRALTPEEIRSHLAAARRGGITFARARSSGARPGELWGLDDSGRIAQDATGRNPGLYATASRRLSAGLIPGERGLVLDGVHDGVLIAGSPSLDLSRSYSLEASSRRQPWSTRA